MILLNICSPPIVAICLPPPISYLSSSYNGIILCVLRMQRLAAHLKRRNWKLLQQQTLPEITAHPASTAQPTPIQYKKKPIIRYVSEITYNPEQHQSNHHKKIIHQRQLLLQQPSISKRHKTLLHQIALSHHKGQPKKRAITTNQYQQARRHLKRWVSPKLKKGKKNSLEYILSHKSQFLRDYFKQMRGN